MTDTDVLMNCGSLFQRLVAGVKSQLRKNKEHAGSLIRLEVGGRCVAPCEALEVN